MAPFKVLIINPNTTVSMTDALKPIVDGLDYNNTSYTFLTNPSPTGPASINSPSDAAISTETILPHLTPLLPNHDAFLVACYSPHPLVSRLRSELASSPSPPSQKRKPVISIFEASVGAAMQLCSPHAPHKPPTSISEESKAEAETEKWGIVSTGKIWEPVLGGAVADMLGLNERGGGPERGFAGVETTGLNAKELHEVPPEVVRRKLEEATGRLVGVGGLRAVLLGCAGMAGMEEWVGNVVGREVWVVDGVKAGVGALQGVLRGGF